MKRNNNSMYLIQNNVTVIFHRQPNILLPNGVITRYEVVYDSPERRIDISNDRVILLKIILPQFTIRKKKNR